MGSDKNNINCTTVRKAATKPKKVTEHLNRLENNFTTPIMLFIHYSINFTQIKFV